MERIVVYYLNTMPMYIQRFDGAKYIFKKTGAYKIPQAFADILLTNDSERFFETKEDMNKHLNESIDISDDVMKAKVRNPKKINSEGKKNKKAIATSSKNSKSKRGNDK